MMNCARPEFDEPELPALARSREAANDAIGCFRRRHVCTPHHIFGSCFSLMDMNILPGSDMPHQGHGPGWMSDDHITEVGQHVHDV